MSVSLSHFWDLLWPPTSNSMKWVWYEVGSRLGFEVGPQCLLHSPACWDIESDGHMSQGPRTLALYPQGRGKEEEGKGREGEGKEEEVRTEGRWVRTEAGGGGERS